MLSSSSTRLVSLLAFCAFTHLIQLLCILAVCQHGKAVYCKALWEPTSKRDSIQVEGQCSFFICGKEGKFVLWVSIVEDFTASDKF